MDRRIISFVLFFIGIAGGVHNLAAQCTGVYVRKLPAGYVLHTPCADMVLMNAESYAQFHFDRLRFQHLQAQLPVYRQATDSLQTLLIAQRMDAEAVARMKTAIIEQKDLHIAAAREETTLWRRRFWIAACTGSALGLIAIVK